MSREQRQKTELIRERLQRNDMKNSSEYQARVQMGKDARIRDAVDKQSKLIHERNEQWGTGKSYDDARRQAERNAEKYYRKQNGE